MENMLFCYIGWAIEYEGREDPEGGGTGGDYGEKYEACNFENCNGKFYGYVQPPGGGGTEQNIRDINNLGVGDDFVEDVTVVWMAPREGWGTVIVGWYEKATVFRKYQKFTEHGIKPSYFQEKRKIDGFRMWAFANKCVRLPVDARIYYPREKRIRNYLYGKNDPLFSKDVFKFIQFVNNHCGDGSDAAIVYAVNQYLETQNESLYASNQRYGGTPEEKKKVEKAAIKRCIAHYKGEGYNKVTDVGKRNKGWDLEATSPGKEPLNIEVKGLSGRNPSVVLTPNEYRAFNERESNYRLAVVVNALKRNKQELFICRSKEHGGWFVEDIGRKKSFILNPDPEDKIFGSIKIKPNK